jgi:Peptidase inhibitor family I36
MQLATVGLAFAGLGLGALLVSASSVASADTSPELTALHYDVPISPGDVSRYHCDDGSYPVIHCFDSAAERDADIVPPTSSAGIPSVPLVVYYVTFYTDANYGGSSFTAAQSISDMRSIGWNDRISSFKSLNNGRPEWWRDIYFGGTPWQWPAGTWVSYVGDDANDQFSSVANVP